MTDTQRQCVPQAHPHHRTVPYQAPHAVINKETARSGRGLQLNIYFRLFKPHDRPVKQAP